MRKLSVEFLLYLHYGWCASLLSPGAVRVPGEDTLCTGAVVVVTLWEVQAKDLLCKAYYQLFLKEGNKAIFNKGDSLLN